MLNVLRHTRLANERQAVADATRRLRLAHYMSREATALCIINIDIAKPATGSIVYGVAGQQVTRISRA